MVLMYNNTTPADINGSGELQAALVTVAGGTANDATAATVTVGTFYVLKSSQVSYYMSATALSDSAVVVAYADASQDYAIVCQVIKLLNQTGVAANDQHIGKFHFDPSLICIGAYVSLRFLPRSVWSDVDCEFWPRGNG